MQFRYADLAVERLTRRCSAEQLEVSIQSHIEPDLLFGTPDEVRTIGSAVPVWALIGYLEATRGDIDAVADAYDIDVSVVEAAVAYYGLHRGDIVARIAANVDPQYVLVNS